MRPIAYSSVAEGVTLGVLFALMGLILLPEVPDQTLLGGYVIIIFLVTVALTTSPISGFTLGVSAVIGEVLAESVYLSIAYGVDIMVLPYAAGLSLFVARIPLFPLAGAFGGYLGREYFAEPKTRLHPAGARRRKKRKEERSLQGTRKNVLS
jgi:hypothetical protein